MFDTFSAIEVCFLADRSRITGIAFGWIGATIAFVSVGLALQRSALI